MPRTIAITGANSGIGLRATARLARDGHHVLALCRDLDRSRPAIEQAVGSAPGTVELVRADLADPRSIREAAAEIADRGPLDGLINNAATFDQSQRDPRFTPEGHEVVWATNHLGPWELTARLSHALARSERPRVAFVASKGLVAFPTIAIRWDALDSGDWYSPTKAYYHAKLAQVMTTQSLADRVGGAADVTCIRVPAVRLDAARLAAQPPLLRLLYAPKNRAAAEPEVLAESYARTMDRWSPEGPVYIDEDLREARQPRFAADVENRERLWAVTAAAVGYDDWAW
jgi:NAD(P)-dependent dehydrogenase (short-subunit alcohol dehydrogenase family)